MNGFAKAKEIEALAMQELMPWLTHKFSPIEICDSLFLQKMLGDFVITQEKRKRACELKAEQRYTGNIYLEYWSNKPRRTPGWLFTSQAELLFYYFCDVRELYVFDFPALWQWAFGADGKPGAIYKYPEKPQTKYDQLNYTWGRIVPIDVLSRAGVPMKVFKPEDRRQP